ncbi:MAG: cupin domain-containing protein [Brevinema sp.]
MQDIRVLVEEVIARILNETEQDFPFDRQTISGGITLIKTKTVKPAPFEVNGNKIKNVYVTDVLTLEESPRLGVAVMEMNATEFPWTLHYDELDYIVDGELEIEANGQTVMGKSGDMIYIPKDSSIIFRSKNQSRFICVMYPANWSEL